MKRAAVTRRVLVNFSIENMRERDFKSHSEYKAALGVKHAEIARTVMQEKRNKKEKK